MPSRMSCALSPWTSVVFKMLAHPDQHGHQQARQADPGPLRDAGRGRDHALTRPPGLAHYSHMPVTR